MPLISNSDFNQTTLKQLVDTIGLLSGGIGTAITLKYPSAASGTKTEQAGPYECGGNCNGNG